MQTTDQIYELIQNMPESEQERLKLWLDRLIRSRNPSDPDEDKIRQGWNNLLELSGCVDLGKCLIDNPDREWIYNERLDDLS